MNDEATEQPSAFMLGKEFIIVLVIVFSGISFTLGYYVGRSGERPQERAAQPLESAVQTIKPDIPPIPQPMSPQPQDVVSQPSLPVKEHEPAAPPIAAQISEKAAVPKKAEKSEAPPQKAEPVQQTKKHESASVTEDSNTLYTVQIGAFKNAADARHLKAEYTKKGYRPYITIVKDRKSQKIYKVKTGEFREKKDAEALATKLKNNEGLKTYVTLKTE